MLGEERLAEERNALEARNAERSAAGKRGALQGLAEEGREPRAEERERKTCGVLVGAKADREERKEQAEQKAYAHAREKAELEAARGMRHRKARNGAHEHDALNAEVEHARLLMNDDADGGNEKGRPRVERGGNDRCGETHQAASFLKPIHLN